MQIRTLRVYSRLSPKNIFGWAPHTTCKMLKLAYFRGNSVCILFRGVRLKWIQGNQPYPVAIYTRDAFEMHNGLHVLNTNYKQPLKKFSSRERARSRRDFPFTLRLVSHVLPMTSYILQAFSSGLFVL